MIHRTHTHFKIIFVNLLHIIYLGKWDLFILSVFSFLCLNIYFLHIFFIKYQIDTMSSVLDDSLLQISHMFQAENTTVMAICSTICDLKNPKDVEELQWMMCENDEADLQDDFDDEYDAEGKYEVEPREDNSDSEQEDRHNRNLST